MSVLFAVAVIGGASSVLTPCVLPLLPALLVVSENRTRRGVWGLALGIETSFFLIGVLLAGALAALGLPGETLQWLAAVSLATFGLVLIVPALHRRFTQAVSRVTSRMGKGKPGTGFSSGFLSGLPLGVVWAPCAGPILAGVALAAGTQQFSGRILVLMAGYAAGMILPLALVVLGGRRLAGTLRRGLRAGAIVPPVMGAVLVGTAVLVATGSLNTVNRFIAETINLTSTPTAGLERRALEGPAPNEKEETLDAGTLRASGYPETDSIADLGPVPELSGITGWINTDGKALSMAGLRGNVVLVDFWTYSCINCIRTLPHLRSWHERYQDDGLVVLGVHTPEFAFEKVPANVADAVEDFDIHYPVALDPEYETWNAFYNRYWPAHYLVDRAGRIRFVHYGEGAYEQTEGYIQDLLAIEAEVSQADATRDPRPRTPEIYLGYLRAARYASAAEGRIQLVANRSAEYVPPSALSEHAWALAGHWRVEGERAIAAGEASILLRFQAREAYVVAGPSMPGGRGEIRASRVSGSKTVIIDAYGLVTVRSGDYVSETIELEVDPGIAVYTFTFG